MGFYENQFKAKQKQKIVHKDPLQSKQNKLL